MDLNIKGRMNNLAMSPLVAVLMLLLAIAIFTLVYIFFTDVTKMTTYEAGLRINQTIASIPNTTV